MALSDHEQALLEQMERALASEDPKFASPFASQWLVELPQEVLG